MTEIIDGPIGKPEYFAFGKGVLHSTLIGHDLNGEFKVTINMLQKIRFYELIDTGNGYEAGDFWGTARMTMEYAGTMTGVMEPIQAN